MSKTVYLDNNATTRVAPEVVEAMQPFFGEFYGNPSSMHAFGGQVARPMEEARAKLAALIGADPGPPIDDATEFDRLHVITISGDHQVTSRIERYGASSPQAEKPVP
jgi:cysteine desulfurase